MHNHSPRCEHLILLGLTVEGESITTTGCDNWARLCHDLLGVIPEGSDLKGAKVKLKWLQQHFGNIRDHAHSQD